jgi:predicted NUDIX family NTP pyrophosphohydrolase
MHRDEIRQRATSSGARARRDRRDDVTRVSSGLIPYRRRSDGALEVLVVHPGGPFFARRDEGAWSIAKGELGTGEDPRLAAGREFAEELGKPVPPGEWIDLGEIRQQSGKVVRAFAVEGPDIDADTIVSNEFEIEWPPGSSRQRSFPEVDRAAWFGLAEARRRLVAAQGELLDRLVAALAASPQTER